MSPVILHPSSAASVCNFFYAHALIFIHFDSEFSIQLLEVDDHAGFTKRGAAALRALLTKLRLSAGSFGSAAAKCRTSRKAAPVWPGKPPGSELTGDQLVAVRQSLSSSQLSTPVSVVLIVLQDTLTSRSRLISAFATAQVASPR